MLRLALEVLKIFLLLFGLAAKVFLIFAKAAVEAESIEKAPIETVTVKGAVEVAETEHNRVPWAHKNM